MNLKSARWSPVAVVLGGLNLAAAGFAAGSGEPVHASVHVGLALACWTWFRSIRQAPPAAASEPQERLEELEAELSLLRGELSETQERLDFAERVMAQNAEARRVGPEH